MHGIRLRPYCILHGVEDFREAVFCDLVRFRFAVIVIDMNAFESEMIMSIVSELYMYM